MLQHLKKTFLMQGKSALSAPNALRRQPKEFQRCRLIQGEMKK